MPSIESKMRQYIADETTKPVYMNIAPPDAEPPYIVQRLITKSNRGMGVVQARLQYDIFGEDPSGYAEMKQLAIDVNTAVESAQDDLDDITASYRVSEMESYDHSVNYHRTILDAMVFYDERPQFD